MNELNIVPIWIVTTLFCIMSYWHGRSEYGWRIVGLLTNIMLGCGRELAEDVKKKILDDYEASVELHQNKYSEEKAKFEETRAKKLEQIEKDGKEAASSRDKLKANEAELHKKMDELNIQLADTQKKYDTAKAELDKFPTNCDLADCEKYFKRKVPVDNDRSVTVGQVYRHFKGHTVTLILLVLSSCVFLSIT